MEGVTVFSYRNLLDELEAIATVVDSWDRSRSEGLARVHQGAR